MKNLLKGALLSLACCGIMVQSTFADGPQNVRKATRTLDVALGQNGSVSGKIVNAQGVAVKGAVISFQKGDQAVAQTVTNKDGEFAVSNLKGGTYVVTAGQNRGVFRMWPSQIAPPNAHKQMNLISQASVVRGAYEGPGDPELLVDFAALGFGIAATAIAIDNNNELDDVFKSN